MVVFSENVCEVEGNLIDLALEGRFDLIAHGCNCHKIMGAGIAGGDWNRILLIIKEELKDMKVTIVKYNKNEV